MSIKTPTLLGICEKSYVILHHGMGQVKQEFCHAF